MVQLEFALGLDRRVPGRRGTGLPMEPRGFDVLAHLAVNADAGSHRPIADRTGGT